MSALDKFNDDMLNQVDYFYMQKYDRQHWQDDEEYINQEEEE